MSKQALLRLTPNGPAEISADYVRRAGGKVTIEDRGDRWVFTDADGETLAETATEFWPGSSYDAGGAADE